MSSFHKTFRNLLMVMFSVWVAILLLPGYGNAGSLQQSAQEGQQLFSQYCQACHSIGGGNLVGPDLQGVTTRRDRAWLERFIVEPDKVLASGDPIATDLLQQFNNIPMPNLGIAPDQAASLLAYLENPDNAGGAPAAPAPAIPTSGNAQRGRALFLGSQPLTNGGTACVSCHSSSDIGVLGGGSMGPDLTQVLTRYGEPGLASSLASLPFPTMAGIFNQRPLTPEEQADLYAYFAQTNTQQPKVLTAGLFWGLGTVGTVVLFLIMLRGWPRQRLSNSARLRGKKA